MEPFFDFAYIEPFLVCENKVKPRLNLYGKAQVEVENILNKCLLEFAKKDSGYDLIIKSYLLSCWCSWKEFKRDLESGDFPFQIRYTIIIKKPFFILKILEDHFYEDLPLEKIAYQFSFSKSYFSYLFRALQ
jgi:hypothetical protein